MAKSARMNINLVMLKLLGNLPTAHSVRSRSPINIRDAWRPTNPHLRFSQSASPTGRMARYLININELGPRRSRIRVCAVNGRVSRSRSAIIFLSFF